MALAPIQWFSPPAEWPEAMAQMIKCMVYLIFSPKAKRPARRCHTPVPPPPVARQVTVFRYRLGSK